MYDASVTMASASRIRREFRPANGLAETFERFPRGLARIHAAARKLEQVAREHGDAGAEELAHELQFHAQTEEQILYPAAVLVGTLLRRR